MDLLAFAFTTCSCPTLCCQGHAVQLGCPHVCSTSTRAHRGQACRAKALGNIRHRYHGLVVSHQCKTQYLLGQGHATRTHGSVARGREIKWRNVKGKNVQEWRQRNAWGIAHSTRKTHPNVAARRNSRSCFIGSPSAYCPSALLARPAHLWVLQHPGAPLCSKH